MELTKPTLLIDKEKCLKNIRKMKDRADRNNVQFRPHFKTHQSSEVGEWIRKEGVFAITVSSVSMAAYFADNGWKDITIAFPVNIAEIEAINGLAAKLSLNLLVENEKVVNFLGSRLNCNVGIYIKIDAGYHRTGMLVSDHQGILSLIKSINKHAVLKFKGLLVHNGHTYKAGSPAEVITIHKQSMEALMCLKDFLIENDIQPEISLGDTPSMSLVEDFAGIDEIRPGNFVLYDVMQATLGSCLIDDVAVALACPVVAKHADRQEIVIYGGAIHLSKDFILNEEGNPIYGKVVLLNGNSWSEVIDGTYVKSLSQEHGVIKADAAFFERINVGDFIGILPVHSCLTVDLMREYFTLNGERITTINSIQT
jgi:D-serine deaminase-like pyridoxal phosphate-dependent protein